MHKGNFHRCWLGLAHEWGNCLHSFTVNQQSSPPRQHDVQVFRSMFLADHKYTGWHYQFTHVNPIGETIDHWQIYLWQGAE